MEKAVKTREWRDKEQPIVVEPVDFRTDTMFLSANACLVINHYSLNANRNCRLTQEMDVSN